MAKIGTAAVHLAALLVMLLGAGRPASAQECTQQNIFFPLAPGAEWTYRVTLSEAGERETLTATRRFVPATAAAAQGAQIAGELTERFDLFAVEAASRMPVAVVGGAVYQGVFQASVSGPEGLDLKALLGGGALQLLLPDMGSLAVGATWNARAAFSAAERRSGKSLTGTVAEADAARVSAVERVTVPAGTFLALRVDTALAGAIAGLGGATERVTQWYGQGVGLIKERTADGSIVRELTAYRIQPCCGFVVVSTQGESSIDGKPAAPGMGASGASEVRVGAGGRLDLALGDGSSVRVAGDSRFSLQTFCDEKRSAGGVTVRSLARTALTIFGGRLMFLIGRLHAPSYDIKTPSAVVGVRGTEFSVEVTVHDGAPVTRVEVVEGSVWVRKTDGTGETVLTAGQSGLF